VPVVIWDRGQGEGGGYDISMGMNIRMCSDPFPLLILFNPFMQITRHPIFRQEIKRTPKRTDGSHIGHGR